MKDLYNKIMYTKFHIGWVFGFLLVCISLCLVALKRLL
jgi:hypothetical protein